MSRNRAFLSMLLGGTILFGGGGAVAATIEVSSGGSIQAAINRAGSGDTIVVAPGTYAPFDINKDGITVKSSTPGGAHIVASGGNRPGISAYGQNNIGIFDFRVTSRGGDGIKIGGSPSRFVKDLRVEGNIIETSRLDGIKVFQSGNVSIVANVIKESGSGGLAGTGGNRNGDGGIDFVGVSDSEVIDNEVNSNGWACAMIKGGSVNNVIEDNDFVKCAKNGVDMAAPTSGNAARANKTGVIAGDSTVANNTIDSGSGGCAIRLGANTRNIKTTNNQIDGPNCNKGSGNGEGASGSDGKGGAGGESRGNGRPDGGGGPGGDSDGLGGYNDEIGGYVRGGSSGRGGCQNMIARAANTAASGIGIVSSIFGGGRATAPLQVAQQLQLIAQTICDIEQAKLLDDQLTEQRRMTARVGGNAASGVRQIERAAREAMGVLSPEIYDEDAGDLLGETYHDGMEDGWTFENSDVHTKILRDATNQANMEAAQTGANSDRASEEAAVAADEAVKLGMEAEGQTGAIQALMQLERIKMANDIAKQRHDTALGQAMLRNEEERRAAEVYAGQKIERFYGFAGSDAEAEEGPGDEGGEDLEPMAADEGQPTAKRSGIFE